MAFEEQIGKFQRLKMINRMLIVTVVASVGPGYFIFTKIEENKSSFVEIEGEIEIKEIELRNLQRRIENFPSTEKKLTDLQDELDALRNRIPAQVETEEILKALSEAISKRTISFLTFTPVQSTNNNTPAKDEKTPPVLSRQVVVDLRGSYAEILAVINDIANFKNMVSFKEITFRSESFSLTDLSLEQMESAYEIQAYLMLEVFYASSVQGKEEVQKNAKL